MQLFNKPVEYQESKFVVTEDSAYFVPFVRRADAPDFIEILREVFDINNPEVAEEVDRRLDEGRVLLGYFNPATGDVDVHVPLEVDKYVQKRLQEVFGDV